MARIRTIKPEFFRHEELFEAEKNTGLPLRLAFAGLWTVADREGRFEYRPRKIKLDVLPYDDIDFDAVLAALVEHGFIVRYEHDGKQYAYIPSWHKHQIVNQREADSVIPAPAEAGACTCNTGAEQVHARGEQEQEGKGREGEKEERADAPEEVVFLDLGQNAEPAPEAQHSPEPDQPPPPHQTLNAPGEIVRRLEAAATTWNGLALKPPQKKSVSLYLTSLNRAPILATMASYSDIEITAAMTNYAFIGADPGRYERKPSYQSLEGFLAAGVEKYVDEADPRARCLKPGHRTPAPAGPEVEDDDDFAVSPYLREVSHA